MRNTPRGSNVEKYIVGNFKKRPLVQRNHPGKVVIIIYFSVDGYVLIGEPAGAAVLLWKNGFNSQPSRSFG